MKVNRCFGTGIVLLALALPARVGAAVPSAHASVERLLYQTNWVHGKLGWSSSGDGSFSVVNNQLTYDGSNGATVMVAPPKLRNMHNFAVEATMRSFHCGLNNYNGCTTGIFVHASKSDFVGTGVKAGLSQVSDGSSSSKLEIWTHGTAPWFDDGSNDLGDSDYDPNTAWHTYRLEVQGTHYRLLVDGNLAVEADSSSYLNGQRVGIIGDRGQFSVSVFKVFAVS